MSDRELLELAAKAAGLKYTKPHPDYDGSLGLALEDEHGRDIADWNPLQDDGDEARLEATLLLDVTWYGDKVVVRSAAEAYADHGSPQSARRRAGVRAAAEIGRNL